MSEGARRAYSAHISDDDVGVLRCLLGFGVYEIYSSSLRADRALLTAPSFSISLGRGLWAVVRSEWIETQEYNDYFRLTVRTQNAPEGIKITEGGGLVEPSQILLVPAAAVTAIEVLAVNYLGPGPKHERVSYDYAIRFLRRDGRHFCIAAEQSIAGHLEFTEDGAVMAKILEGRTIRLRIE